MAHPIVVGVDGSESALEAVRWAAREAARRGIGLRLVHALEPSDDPEVLRAAESVAGMPVTLVTGTGSPAELLVRESGHASLVVLGGRGHGGFTGRLVGTTARTLAARGRCPMVVMRGEPGPGPVVVGTDGTRTSDAAVAFARQEALVRGTGLLIVQSAPDVSAVRQIEVDVRHEIVPDAPGEALLDRAADAQLIVVGSRARIGHRGQVLRATAQLLLHRAPCPVAVVRWDQVIDPLWTVRFTPASGDGRTTA